MLFTIDLCVYQNYKQFLSTIVTCLFKETIMKKLQKSVDSGHLEYNKSSISVTLGQV